MDKIAKLFTVRGRAGRVTYWKISLLALLIMAVGWCGGLLLAIVSGVEALSAVAIIGFLLAVPISLAIAIRRLHDRNKSAWWLLIFSVLPAGAQLAAGSLRNSPDPPLPLVSFALALAGLATSLWALVELGFLRGTPGPNRYGEDPLETGASESQPIAAVS